VPSFRVFVSGLVLAGLCAAPAFATRVHHNSSHPSHSSHAASSHPSSPNPTHHPHRHASSTHGIAHKSHRIHGQQAIDSDRVTQIQQALIREHYLNGDANGAWDDNTKAAMQKFQADQGWQTKLMPDSRALKKLGLGPDYSNALNAKNSNFAAPPSNDTIPAPQSAGFTAASHINQ
jgi:hypothetical protein